MTERTQRAKKISAARKTPRGRVARHEIREEIERRILSGETPPGQRLSQQSLARELGVAQGTVRESLLELQWLGLVQSIDRFGVFVDKLDVERICEAYLVREVMEGLAAKLACHTVGRSDIAELRRMADDIHKLTLENNVETASSLDRGFHNRITELSRNETLLRISKSYRALGMTVRAFRDPSIILGEHRRIVDAIEHSFADEAERQARVHVMGTREAIEKCAKEGTYVPQWVK